MGVMERLVLTAFFAFGDLFKWLLFSDPMVPVLSNFVSFLLLEDDDLESTLVTFLTFSDFLG